MKNKIAIRLLALLLLVTLGFVACTEDVADVRLAPTIESTQNLNIKPDSVTIVGFVVADGDGFYEKGACYSTSPNATIADNKVVYTGANTSAAFKVKIGGLDYATQYYARAYATNAQGTIYGKELVFTTSSVVPMLTTTVISSIAGTTAVGGGNVTANGGEAVTERGVCWSTVHNPTIADGKTINEAGNGTFTSNLTGLLGKTTYYVRAYATNKVGTGYGNEVSFTTLVAPPTVTTTAITNVTADGASSGGNVTISGGDIVTARGVCWSISENPTVADSKTSNGTGTGVFTSALTGLNIATMYHVRAYATNSAGTGYGPDVTFMTFPNAIYALGDGTAAGWDNTAAVKIDQSGTAGVYVGTLDLVAAKSMKFILNRGAWQPQWGQATGQAAGVLGVNLGSGSDPDAITTPDADGKYKVTVDLGNMTYKVETAFPSALYLIGDGVGSWNWSETDLPMIPVNSHPNLFWKIVWLNSTGGFKMAPVKDWGNDFGKSGDAVDGVYQKGGDNIPVPGTAGYYMVVVDLTANKIAIAEPKVYLMGNTIGSWDTSNAAGLFTVNNASSLITITKTLAADELRMYAWHPWFTDWWQSEFIVLNGKIAFRGNGGDQQRVSVAAGSHTINLNFKTGDGAIQ